MTYYNLDLTYKNSLLFRMENETDPELLEKQRKLWKLFGRQTKAGKELFSLYNISQKPKIVYPKVKQKTQKQIQQENQRMTVTKKCPQKTVIQYPEEPKLESKYHAIDFVPKRKNQNVIRMEIEQYYRRRAIDVPANRGVDRAALVKKLQQKFKMQNGGLPKGAELPGIYENVVFDEEKIKQQAKNKMQMKYNNKTTEIKKEKEVKDLKTQLQDLFDKIVAEIDQRQQYLDSIQHLEQPKIKARIKQQMIERVGQLQRITELKKK